MIAAHGAAPIVFVLVLDSKNPPLLILLLQIRIFTMVIQVRLTQNSRYHFPLVWGVANLEVHLILTLLLVTFKYFLLVNVNMEYKVEFEDGPSPLAHIYSIDEEREIEESQLLLTPTLELNFKHKDESAKDLIGRLKSRFIKGFGYKNDSAWLRIELKAYTDFGKGARSRKWKLKEGEEKRYEENLINRGKKEGFNVIKADNREEIEKCIEVHEKRFSKSLEDFTKKISKDFRKFVDKKNSSSFKSFFVPFEE